MRIIFAFFIAALFFASCKEETKKEAKKETIDPRGRWENPTVWENNYITLTVRPDSVMLFKCKKLFCPGTKYFISVGKWSVQNDSLLVVKAFTDGRKYEIKDLFPELTGLGSDTLNIISLDLAEAKFILTKDSLFDIDTTGLRSKDKIYTRKGN